VAEQTPGVEVVDERRRGLVLARETGRRYASGDLLVYLDADSRLPLDWLDMVERAFRRRPGLVGLSGAFRFYDWHDRGSRALVRLYDCTVAPLTHLVVHHVLGIGAVFYGGAFCVRRWALDAINGFDTSIDFHGEDANLGRRLTKVGSVRLNVRRRVFTSARRFHACGASAVFRLYARNFWWELLRHRPRDTRHVDVRAQAAPGEVRAEVEECLRTLGAGVEGFIVSPCPNVQVGTPVESMPAMVETAWQALPER
jgi:glycosyltransferase involved in cell wall biosynthesis